MHHESAGACLTLARSCESRTCRHRLDRPTLGTLCALDAAAEGPVAIDMIGEAIGGYTESHVRQIEARALAKYRERLVSLGLETELAELWAAAETEPIP